MYTLKNRKDPLTRVQVKTRTPSIVSLRGADRQLAGAEAGCSILMLFGVLHL